MLELEAERARMVNRQLRRRGIHDECVLDAFATVPREAFVPVSLHREAYKDYPLSIGEGQTISQPFIIALMVQYLGLTGRERVLEVGTGSGYQTAILALLARQVYSIERFPSLADRAQKALDKVGADNVEVRVGDGSEGLAEFAPYGGIVVSAGAPEVPPALISQLDEAGVLVAPVGSVYSQRIHVVRKDKGVPHTHIGEACVFVPLVGSHGWEEKE